MAWLEEKVKQSDIARRLEVSLSSIARLAKNFKTNSVMIPSQKFGSGRKKKYSKSLIKFMKIEINQNPMMTSKEMKVKNKKKLGKLSERTIRRILLEDLKLPSYICSN